MSVIGLGTAAIGRPQYINIRQTANDRLNLKEFREGAWRILNQAYDLGIRYFDTAPGYGFAEALLIEWLEEKKDQEIEVATKWGYTYVANFDPQARQHEVKEHSLGKLLEQWRQSEQLFPYLTTYQIHSATFSTGVLENQAVLEQLANLKSEYNLLIGITTTGADQLAVLRKALEVIVDGIELFDVFQSTYNILDQSIAEVGEELAVRNKRLIVKEALANGRLFPNERYPHHRKLYDQLTHLARKYNVGIDAIALRFCQDNIPAYAVLSGASIDQHLTQNLKANQIQMVEEDLKSLETFSVSSDAYWAERKQLDWN